MMLSPCKDCERRKIGCHGSCPDYISYKEELDKANAILDEEHRNHYWKTDVIPYRQKSSARLPSKKIVDYS